MTDTIILIIGSAPDAVRATAWPKAQFSHMVAINNAWQIRQDWDYLIHPEDFPVERHPSTTLPGQAVITAEAYVPIQNHYGGFLYAGGTMAFTAAYWALGHFQPTAILFIGCDMVYSNTHQSSHFYGAGTADPLREDHSLQSLEAKSARFLYYAQQQACAVFNLSLLPSSKLLFPRLDYNDTQALPLQIHQRQQVTPQYFNPDVVNAALALEKSLGYYFASGRYWEHADTISASACREVDHLWLTSLTSPC